MMTQSQDQDVFSQSLGSVGHWDKLEDQESKRKRHKSAGDHYSKSVDSCRPSLRQRRASQDDKNLNKLSNLMLKTEDIKSFEEESAVDSDSDMKGLNGEIKDSGVALDYTDLTNGNVEDTVDECLPQGTDSNSSSGLDIDDKSKIENKDELEKLVSVERDESSKIQSDSLTVCSSPMHSMPTPVTENDPLGLFIEDGPPQVKVSVTRTKSPVKNRTSASVSPEKVREKFVSGKPFEDYKNKDKRTEDTDSLGECNNTESEGKVIVSRSGSTASTGSGVLSPVVEKVQRRLFSIERTNSFPDDLGNAGNSNSMFRQNSTEQTETEKLLRSSSSLNESGKSEPSRNSRDFRTFFGHRPGSFRRHKENLSGMWKQATGAVATKLSEIKHSMTPTKLGSNSSLTPSVDDWDSGTGDEDSLHETPRKSGSVDYLRQSTDKLDGSSHYAPHLPAHLQGKLT